MSAKKALDTSHGAGKRLIVLFILVAALVIALTTGTLVNKNANRFTPDLALDLEGGTELILTPVTTDGSDITDSDVNQAIEIIRQRVDASGVAEAEIASQGGSNIVVSLPGTPSKETLDLVRTSAVLRLRPVIAVMNPMALTQADVDAAQEAVTSESATSSASSESSASGESAISEDAQQETAQENSQTAEQDQGDQTAQESDSSDSDKAADSSDDATSADKEKTSKDSQASKPLTGDALKKAAMAQADTDGDGKLSDTPATEPANSSDTGWITEQVMYDALTLTCGSDSARIAATKDDPKKPFVACASEMNAKYILGPSEIEGTELTKATSSLAVNDQGTPTGGWAVNMEFNSKGGKAFQEVTERIYKLTSPQNQFAIVLDGQVLSAPVPNGPISGGHAQITGSFTSEEAASLANQLSFGSLPLNFTVQSEEQISATLGGDQLAAGLIAGLIGLALIVIYLLWQYHSLGLISAASIALSTGLSYLVVCLLSWVMGYRLSMAGVLGMIVSVGITADSFIVYFERIRDEIRDGRTIPGAIDHGWDRAKRTIIISDAVNLIASIVLYILTVGSVRGFAFTLGITTILDLVVVMMFTHPLMVKLMKTTFFGQGKKFSGLEESQLQRTPLYRGRGSFELVSPAGKSASSADGSASSIDGAAAAKLAHMSDADQRTKTGSSHSAGEEAAGTEGVISAPPMLVREGETLAERKARQRRARKHNKAHAEVSASTEAESSAPDDAQGTATDGASASERSDS